ncbi:quinolinate synthase NadA [Thermospira aquatica]|uniref:Quinolinate synthase n=1 Tax=Thermospira aquatica TaxID=2828656 RepID=A0AAX3BDB0_9SPIR|nr:quinolinate synthase NadA [Thermospira aquatica]URA10304.1 quinolinate synthase NadA [Thermospira aquatica]
MNIPELQKAILQLKKEKNAYILAHNYQLPEIQDVADHVADSLGMARHALTIKEDLVVVCGVYFMAETVSILNPEKRILIPDTNAGCPLANFAPIEEVRRWRQHYPDHTFVAYVNSSAKVKAEVDICCTSANAVDIVRRVEGDKIVFLPDKNLGRYVQKRVPEKEIVLWPGFCVVHETADIEAIVKTKELHPDALVVVHPECPEEIQEMADGICSTGQMIQFVENHPETKEFIIVTEWGMVYALQKRFPDRVFIEPSHRMECKNMKRITLAKLYDSLKEEKFVVKVDEQIRQKAYKSIEKMLA